MYLLELQLLGSICIFSYHASIVDDKPRRLCITAASAFLTWILVSLNSRPTCTHTLLHTLHKPCSLFWTFCKPNSFKISRNYRVRRSSLDCGSCSFCWWFCLDSRFSIQMKRLEDLTRLYDMIPIGSNRHKSNGLLESLDSKAWSCVPCCCMGQSTLAFYVVAATDLVNMCKSLKQCRDLEKDGKLSNKGANKKARRARV